MNSHLRSAATLLVLLSLAAATDAAAPAAKQPTVRCAVIGGMIDVGFWPALAERFEHETGIHAQTVVSGPKEVIAPAFKKGGIDLIVMHASDTMLNLVADGYARDAQPFARNDMVIVGPSEDPAGIKGMTDAGAALKKLVDGKSAFIVHSSVGAQEVLHGLMDDHDVTLDPDHTTVLLEDKQRRVLHIAADKKAYTIIGRIPFLDGKIPGGSGGGSGGGGGDGRGGGGGDGGGRPITGMAVMVRGDAKLRRPFLVAVAEPTQFKDVHVPEARKLAAFLRERRTQEWIGQFGKGKFDDAPLFYPVAVP